MQVRATRKDFLSQPAGTSTYGTTSTVGGNSTDGTTSVVGGNSTEGVEPSGVQSFEESKSFEGC